MDAINTAASLLSAPPLPAPVGSQQKFQRPLLPAGLSKLLARDQLADHEERVQRLEQELREHRANTLPTNAKSALVADYREKDAFLHYEVFQFSCGFLWRYVSDLLTVCFPRKRATRPTAPFFEPLSDRRSIMTYRFSNWMNDPAIQVTRALN